MALINKEFEQIYKTHVAPRDVNGELWNYLVKSDFFVAPASARFHLKYAGGLAEHSVNVYKRLKKLLALDQVTQYGEDSIAIVALLHDLCKANYYKLSKRNVKENGMWKEVDYYTVEERLPYGHGEKSVFIIMNYVKLSKDEALAINWHMGGWDSRVKGGDYSISDAYRQCSLAVYLHLADIQATYIDENHGEE